MPGSQVLDRVYPVDTSSLLPDVVLEGIVNEFYPHHPKVYGLEAISNFFRGTLRYQVECVMWMILLDKWGRKTRGSG